MLKEIIKIKNGNIYMDYLIFECDTCSKIIEEAWPRTINKNNDEIYCLDCSFKKGQFSSHEYLSLMGISTNHHHAAVNPDGEIVVWSGKKTPPWERTKCQQRKSPEYVEWRNKVFERDSYTCQKCGEVGGTLNAHHIKSFKKYPKLRTVLKNGATLCVECHKEEHQRR